MAKIILKGTKEQKIYQMLQKAGWFPGRKVDVSHVIKYYQNRNIKLSDKAIHFFEEYYNIKSDWDIVYTWEINGKSRGEHRGDFHFNLFPYPEYYKTDVRDFMYDDADFIVKSEEYKSALEYSKETIALVGQIGYYYPACVWIGKSGKLYCTHDYNDDVLVFDTIIELMLHELSAHNNIIAIIIEI